MALSYRWVAGEVIRDRVTMEMSIAIVPSVLEEDVEMEVAVTTVTRVVSVDEKGNATLEITTEDIEILDSNSPAPPGQLSKELSQPQTLTVAPDGKIIESSNPLLGPGGLDDQGFTRTPFLPDGPVAPGDAWEVDHFQELGFGEGGFDLHAENRLIRYDEVNGVETVVVKSNVTGPLNFSFKASDLAQEGLAGGDTTDVGQLSGAGEIRYIGELEMEGKTWIDPLTGDVLRGEGDGSVSMSFELEGLAGKVPEFTMEMEIGFETHRL